MDNSHTIKNPLVSVILPTWNRAGLLEKAVEGILQQTYKNFELIVVDDGSTDQTPAVIKKIQEKFRDPRIRYLRQESHIGGAQARNVAIRASRGKFIASQDDDDEWHHQYLEKQVGNLLSLTPDYGMSYVSYWRILPEGKRVAMPPKNFKPKSGNIYGGDIMHKNYCPFQAGMIRKSVLDDVGLVDEEMNSLYDWEMWLRISRKYKIGHLDEPLFTWHFSPKSNSSDPKKIWWRIDARKIILRKYGDDIRRFGYMAQHMSRLSDLLIEAGDIKHAQSVLIEGIKSKFFSPILWVKLLATIFGRSGYLKLQDLRRRSFLKYI